MDEVEKRVLSQMRSRLVKEVVVTESFLSAFCDCNVLDDQMTRLLKTERDYEQRACRLLELLPGRGNKAFYTLMEILEVTNPWLTEKIKAALHEERNRDSKINIHPSVSQNATIEGYGHSRLHIDTDIKERATRYVRSNLNHLTEVEQRGVDKWLADELQRERRRQQFRAPHNLPRHPCEFQSTKESQTDTTNMDLREMYEEMIIYLHGVDYVEISADFSFDLFQTQVKELLTRTRKMDVLFLNCLDKFDDCDKYSMGLPELIERHVTHERDRMRNAMEDDRKLRQKAVEEREQAKRQVKRLEDELERLVQKQSQLVKPQEIQLTHKHNVGLRYSLIVPEQTHRNDVPFRSTTAAKADSNPTPPDSTQNSAPPTPPVVTSTSINVVYTEPTPKRAESLTNVAPPPAPKIRRHASEESLKIALSKEDAETTSVSQLNGVGCGASQQYLMNMHRARGKAFQDSNHNNNAKQQPPSSQSNHPSQQQRTQQHPQQNHQQQQQQQPVTKQQSLQRQSRADLQNKMARMLATSTSVSSSKSKQPTTSSTNSSSSTTFSSSYTSTSSSSRPTKRSESEKAVPTHGGGASSYSNQWRCNDPAQMFRGNPSLQASYENIAAASRRAGGGERVVYGSLDTPNIVVTPSGKGKGHSDGYGDREQQQQSHGIGHSFKNQHHHNNQPHQKEYDPVYQSPIARSAPTQQRPSNHHNNGNNSNKHHNNNNNNHHHHSHHSPHYQQNPKQAYPDYHHNHNSNTNSNNNHHHHDGSKSQHNFFYPDEYNQANNHHNQQRHINHDYYNYQNHAPQTAGAEEDIKPPPPPPPARSTSREKNPRHPHKPTPAHQRSVSSDRTPQGYYYPQEDPNEGTSTHHSGWRSSHSITTTGGGGGGGGRSGSVGAVPPLNSHTAQPDPRADGIYGTFVQPSPTSPHRPTLTYVPPPTVPPLTSDHAHMENHHHRAEKHNGKQNHHHNNNYNFNNNNNSHNGQMFSYTAQAQNHHHPNQQQYPPSPQQTPSDVSYPPQSPSFAPNSTTSPPILHPVSSPKLPPMNQRNKHRQDNIPPPPSFPAPPPPVQLHDRYMANSGRPRTPSPPPPPPLQDPNSRSRPMSRDQAPQSPRAGHHQVYPPTHPQSADQARSAYTIHQQQQYDQAPLYQAPPIPAQQPVRHHHTHKTPPSHIPPPPPTAPQAPSQQHYQPHRDLNSVPAGVRSPRTASPSRANLAAAVTSPQKQQPSTATADQLAQVKLRNVSESIPETRKQSLETSDTCPSPIAVRLRPTPGKFSNIYSEEQGDTTLPPPPPPPPDDLDELPPPPPPPELLTAGHVNHDLRDPVACVATAAAAPPVTGTVAAASTGTNSSVYNAPPPPPPP
ncbi:DNA N6-methyl adenine demethylase, partial [Aplysia californica]|uniref:DNA N6-methyl adenine demethylase n=1 Tax=Aplysia californica TaxID=6500 RepID=A0ABM1A8Q4_APLCA